MMLIDDEILEKITYVSKYIGNSTNNWVRVKREILLNLRPSHRKLFSKRHKTSKKHFLNDFEAQVIKFWQVLTGIVLVLEESQTHRAEDERPPRHWGLALYNKKRQEIANDRKQK